MSKKKITSQPEVNSSCKEVPSGKVAVIHSCEKSARDVYIYADGKCSNRNICPC